MANYYKPSGKFSLLSLIYFILISLTALPLLGLLYAYCIWYIPLIYVNFLIAAGFGLAVGTIISKVVIGTGKVRNVTLSLLLGLLGGLIVLYFHWAVWVDLVINAGESYGSSKAGITVSNIKILQVFSLASDPGTLLHWIKEINKTGTWGIRSTTVSGTFLSVIWIIEFLIVAGIASIVPMLASKNPYCEIGDKWFEEKKLPAFSYIESKEKMIADLEKTSNNSFDDLVKVENIEQSHSIFTLYTSQNSENYLSIENKTAKTDSKGKIDFDNDEVVEYISINNQLCKILLEK
jgi:hypothetical protein